jgi:opacity protein-like surface antigen
VGGGVETALDNNWSAKFEALHVDLGGLDTAFGGVTNTTVTNALNTPQQGFNTSPRPRPRPPAVCTRM